MHCWLISITWSINNICITYIVILVLKARMTQPDYIALIRHGTHFLMLEAICACYLSQFYVFKKKSVSLWVASSSFLVWCEGRDPLMTTLFPILGMGATSQNTDVNDLFTYRDYLQGTCDISAPLCTVVDYCNIGHIGESWSFALTQDWNLVLHGFRRRGLFSSWWYWCK